jgi:tetratricopeptide (TPR) repeat protein
MITTVRAWEETITLPTYPVYVPEKFPIFLDRRAYQGSSGRVYPNAFTERVSDDKELRPYRAVFLENEYVRLMMLPEIGGRIHVGFDKTRQYDFFYRQRVIKPALVGLLGPWISGGVEFNWPQHHRPSTFMPVEHALEHHADGSATVWLSEHESMHRMKGMVGICLHPGKSLVEAKARLYNRTPMTRTFLWWANTAVPVHEQYMAFFPPDVHWVADHAKRAISSFPIARDFYYGVDYRSGVDIRWYKNIPVPTSYMVMRSDYDFLGGYDYAKKCGVVLVADRHIAPGKKLWTWGSDDFGKSWDCELTDEDGPYIELMTGVYTDNQPDFSFTAPYETKSFSQFWYPIQDIGPAKNANPRLALSLEIGDSNGEIETGNVRIGACPTEQFADSTLCLTSKEKVLWRRGISIAPGDPFVETVKLTADSTAQELELSFRDSEGNLVLTCRAESQTTGDPPQEARPETAQEPPVPENIAGNDELYITGLHLHQYRHATRTPESYWQEVLKRDPDDSRVNTALGALHLERGEFVKAIAYLERAWDRLTQRNPNPREGEAMYLLGLAKQYLSDLDGAAAAFAKSAWNWAWQAPAYYALAVLSSRQGDVTTALARIDQSLMCNGNHLKAMHLQAVLLRRSGRIVDARQVVEATEGLDMLDCGSQWEKVRLADAQSAPQQADAFFNLFRHNAQTILDLALDYAAAGFYTDSALLIEELLFYNKQENAHPMLFYMLAWLAVQQNDLVSQRRFQQRAASAQTDYCFPSRIEEMLILEDALRHDETDARAHSYLAMLLYDKERREDAIQHWRRAAELAPEWSMPWRNLGLALFNVHQDASGSFKCYARAIQCEPENARLLYEWDQLRKRVGTSPEERLAVLQSSSSLVYQRDDLTIELISLLNLTGQYERAIEMLMNRRFHPWEGGEGLVSGQWILAHFWLAAACIDLEAYPAAIAHLEQARSYPHNLGEGKHLLTMECHLDYLTGVALYRIGRPGEASAAWGKATDIPRVFDWRAVWQTKALQALGRTNACDQLLQWLEEEAERRLKEPAKIDYFATSLPNFLLFDDDLKRRNTVECLRVRGLCRVLQGKNELGDVDLKTALKLDPNHSWLNLEIEHLPAIAADAPPFIGLSPGKAANR